MINKLIDVHLFCKIIKRVFIDEASAPWVIKFESINERELFVAEQRFFDCFNILIKPQLLDN